MAIAFARPEYVGRSDNKNACCKSSYNSRSKIVDERTGKVFNFTSHGGNAYHETLLPKYVDKKFKNAEGFSNEVERAEKRKDSQLYVEWLLALPKEKEITLEMKKEIIKEFIERKGWIKEGLGVQIDIHEPHDGEKNWHAHLLVTTRRFRKDGLGLEDKKAVDLQPEIKYGKVQKTAEIDNHKFYENVLNDKFKAWGLDLRADLPGEITQEHIGPIRMRSIFNEAARRNEERKEAEIEHLNSGVRVLEKVTKHLSVFTKGDLSRAVKYIPDSEVRARLVEGAVSDKSIIPLYVEEGSKTKYFTTKEIRDEENKILRLSGYVANLENFMSSGGKISRIANELVASSADGLTDEQHKALSSVLLGDSGLRVLRGRAGAGKSYVLGRANKIAMMSGVNVIGLAPTHKAKLGLAECGYERVDTVKGMLFKLANSRFDLPKHSLLVVDEAGMIGNDDYKELLRVAATRKCNVVLAGDERQLASVSRGGMFEVFAGRYGSSTILDIQRQSGQWGKSVAMSMSEGRVESAISILESENRIKWDESSHVSMESLIKDWNKSEYNIGDRLILAVKNSDVAALNHGVRQYLKLSGDLTGEEFAVAGNHYMQGDRVLITKTNKELGLINGDLAEIAYASSGKFTIKLRDNTASDSKEGEYREYSYKEISFNPSEYSGFRHGYATTIFKAQGASIKDVFVYHNGFAGIRNSYVALSRMVEELKLYVNKESTANKHSLISQLSRDAEAGSSLSYLTESELESKELSRALENDSRGYVRGINRFIDFVGNTATKLADKYIPSSEYYNYKEPKGQYESVSQVIDRTYAELEGKNIQEEKLVVGGNNQHTNHDTIIGKAEIGHNSTLNSLAQKDSGVEGNAIYKAASANNWKSKESAKTRFYRNADRVRAIRHYADQKEEWAREYELLKSEIKFKAEYIAKDLLGNPNKRLSNGRELRYGDHGRLAVRIAGEKAGTWYDFAKDEGGDMFALVQEKHGYDFKDAADYLRSRVGMSNPVSFKPSLQLVYDHANSDSTKEYIQEKDAKIRYANKLYDKSKLISENSIASAYLKGHRGITCKLSSDIKTTGIYDHNTKEYLPALVAFAKDSEGKVTGGQHILLDKKTNGKADVEVPKKSFGKIAGSFVDVGGVNEKVYSAQAKDAGSITIIAEGLETGLSIKESMGEHSSSLHKEIEQHMEEAIKILCSLGISNIKNYQPNPGEKIIIAADNDGVSSNTTKTIENAKQALVEKGTFVEIVRPKKEGDFNDMLQDKVNGGTKEIAKVFNGAIARHSATTLLEYFAKDNGSYQLSKAEMDKIKYLSKFKIDETNIINAYRINHAEGAEELEKTVKPISIAHAFVQKRKDIIGEINDLGGNIDKHELTLSFRGKSNAEMDSYISGLREKTSFQATAKGLSKNKMNATTINQALSALREEQGFLAFIHNNHTPGVHSQQFLNSMHNAYRNQENEVFNKVEKLAQHMSNTEIKNKEITSIIKNANNSHVALNSLTTKYHGYVSEVMHKALEDIGKGTKIISEGKSFSCKIKFIDHILETQHDNQFFPKEYCQKLLHQELEKSHQLSHVLHGPTR